MQSVDVSELVQAVKIAIWKTGHEIADKVAEAVHKCIMLGWDGVELPAQIYHTGELNEWIAEDWKLIDAHIGYGILRGMADVYRNSSNVGTPWICIDRGYWKPSHFDGYYRISLNGTQQTTGLDKLEPDYERWDKLGLDVLDRPTMGYEREVGAHQLVCPPTDHVAKFFAIESPTSWAIRNAANTQEHVYRFKGADTPIDWNKVRQVITFNSSVGWEALRQCIPCESDSCFSFVGAYKKYFDHGNFMDVDSRRRMFAVQAGLQLTLEEIRQGLLWPLITRLMKSISDTTIEKKSAVT